MKEKPLLLDLFFLSLAFLFRFFAGRNARRKRPLLQKSDMREYGNRFTQLARVSPDTLLDFSLQKNDVGIQIEKPNHPNKRRGGEKFFEDA